jgi:hypothetical protein
MPWTAPSPIGPPPAYSCSWMPVLHPHTGSPRLLGSCTPTQAYYSALTYSTYDAPPPPPYSTDGSSYYMSYQPPAPLPSPVPAPSYASKPSWDQATFLQAMNHFAAQGNSCSDWIFDSRASIHMSSSCNIYAVKLHFLSFFFHYSW